MNWTISIIWISAAVASYFTKSANAFLFAMLAMAFFNRCGNNCQNKN